MCEILNPQGFTNKVWTLLLFKAEVIIFILIQTIFDQSSQA